MRTRTFVSTLVVTCLALAGCGGDDDSGDAGGADGADQPAVEAPADDDFIAPEPAAEGDLIGTILVQVFGLSPEFLTAEQRACMNELIAPEFPNGVPDDIGLTQEVLDVINPAADNCGVTLR